MGQKFRTVTLPDGKKQYNFFCPGCKCYHGFKEGVWTFDGNLESPTVYPSLLTTGENTCHLFIRKGKLEFLSDCSHELAGRIVDMKDDCDE